MCAPCFRIMGVGCERPRSNGAACRKEIEVKEEIAVDARTSGQRQKDLGEKAGLELEIDCVAALPPSAAAQSADAPEGVHG